MSAATELAAALHVALNLPAPAPHSTASYEERRHLAEQRSEFLVTALEGVATDRDAALATETIATAADLYPVRYQVREAS